MFFIISCWTFLSQRGTFSSPYALLCDFFQPWLFSSTHETKYLGLLHTTSNNLGFLDSKTN
jgi:hypothetical protein